jgi:hypothetical protein
MKSGLTKEIIFGFLAMKTVSCIGKDTFISLRIQHPTSTHSEVQVTIV